MKLKGAFLLVLVVNSFWLTIAGKVAVAVDDQQRRAGRSGASLVSAFSVSGDMVDGFVLPSSSSSLLQLRARLLHETKTDVSVGIGFDTARDWIDGKFSPFTTAIGNAKTSLVSATTKTSSLPGTVTTAFTDFPARMTKVATSVYTTLKAKFDSAADRIAVTYKTSCTLPSFFARVNTLAKDKLKITTDVFGQDTCMLLSMAETTVTSLLNAVEKVFSIPNTKFFHVGDGCTCVNTRAACNG